VNQPVVDFLLARRSSKPALLAAPGPSPAELETILKAASRVPDHKKLAPWRFIVFEGAARAAFGERLAEICAAEEADGASPARIQTERERFVRAPLVVCVVYAPKTDKPVPEIEQLMSTGAACFNLCLAANALGYGTSWITEWYAFNRSVGAVLGLAKDEQVAGFVYVGTATEDQPDRDRPDLADIVTRWQAP
jgi:nitroreductase